MKFAKFVFAFVVGTVYAQSDSRDCIAIPNLPECVDYTLPATRSQEMIADICHQMPSMPGCSIQSLCSHDPSALPHPYCSSFSILHTLCADKPILRGCRTLNALCRPASIVQQCGSEAAIPNIIKSDLAYTRITQICDEKWSDECNVCLSGHGPNNLPRKCNLLASYVSLCYTSESEYCSEIKSICSTYKLPDCPPPPLPSPSPSPEPSPSPSPTPPPPAKPHMMMYLHAGITEYVLFDWAVPQNFIHFSGALVLIILMAAFWELGIGFYRSREIMWGWEEKQMRQQETEEEVDVLFSEVPDMEGLSGLENENPDENTPLMQPGVASRSWLCWNWNWWSRLTRRTRIRVMRALLRCILILIAYLLMLLVMTYNVAILGAVLVGVFIGSLIGGGWGSELNLHEVGCH